MLERIKASIPALPPAEQRVAKLLLADPRSFATLPVSELADRAHVSKPTVVRFCRSVGYDGLADFKLKLAGTVNEGVPFVHRAVDEDDKPGDLIVKVIDNAVAAMLKYRNNAAGHAFEQALTALTAAGQSGKRIEFYGVGNSGIVAQDAQHKFFRLGVHATAVSDGHVQVMSRHHAGCGRLRGGHQQLRPQPRPDRRRRHRPPQGRHGDRHHRQRQPAGATGAKPWPGAAGRRPPEDFDRYSPMVSRLLHLTIIDILTTGVALRLGPGLRPMLQEIKRNLRSKRYAVPGAPEAG